MKLFRPLFPRTLRMLRVIACCLPCVALPAGSQSVTLVPNTTKYAGTSAAGWNGDFGQAGALDLSGPGSIAFDALGGLYISDTGNNCIRRVDPSGSSVTVVAGLVNSTGSSDTCNTAANASPTPVQGLLRPAGIAVDSGNNLYIADYGHNCVRELPAGSTGTASLITVAGTCGVPALASATAAPTGVYVDASGTLYVATSDTADSIYQLLKHARGAAAVQVCVAGGAASVAAATPCAGITNNVTLNAPSSITADPVGNIYLSDTLNNCIRELSSAGVFSTTVGTCGSAASALTNPRGLVFSQAGNLFFVTSSPSRYFRYDLSTGTLLQVGGLPNGSTGPYATTQGGAAAPTVPLNMPLGIAIDAGNNTYVADTGNNIVRRFSFGTVFAQAATGSATTANPSLLTFLINTDSNLTLSAGPDYTILAGQNTCNGPQTAAPAGASPVFCSVSVAFTPTRPGKRDSPLLVMDSVTPSGSITVGLQGVGVGPQALLFQGVASTLLTGVSSGIGVTTDSAGNVYVLEQGSSTHTSDIRIIPANGGASSIAIDTSALTTPSALATDAGGNWYVADAATGTVERFAATGSTTPSYITGLDNPIALFVDGFGNAVVGENGTRKDIVQVYSGGPRRVVAGGGTAAPAEGLSATSVAFQSVTAVAQALDGSIYVGDAAAHRVYGIDVSGNLHIVAGNGTASTADGSTALGQGLAYVSDIDIDPAGDLLITDSRNNKVLLLYSATATTQNLVRVFGNADSSTGYSGDGGASNLASLNGPTAATVAPNGSIYVVDRGNDAVRRIAFPSYPSYPLLNFGSQAVGSTTTMTQALFNEGNATLVRTTSPAISDPRFSNDATSTTCGLSIIPGFSCTLGFDFSPSAGGTYTGTASIADSDPNSPQVVGLTGTAVTSAVAGVTAPIETETYGGPYAGTVTITAVGTAAPAGSVTFSIDGGAVTCTIAVPGAGTYTCTLPNGTLLPASTTAYPVSITYTSTGNPAQTATTTLTENRKPLTEAVNNQTKQYLQPNPTLTGTPNGALTGVAGQSFTVSYSTTATQNSPAGNYPIVATITPATGTNPANYAISNTPGTLTIQPANLTTFSGAGSPETEVYGGTYSGSVTYSTNSSAPTGTLTFSVGGKVICTTPVTGATSTTCTNPAGSGLPAGSYTVTIAYSGNSMYAATTTLASLTVIPAPLTITVNSQTKAFGAANPTLTGTVTGTTNGDTLGTTLGVTYSTTVNTTTPAGVYGGAITATLTGTASGSYTVTVVPGTFTITGNTSSMTLTTSGTPVQVGTSITFTAVVSSTSGTPNGPVVFSSDGTVLGTGTLDNTGTATLTTGALTPGSHAITAVYNGNGNFGPSSASLTEVVTAPVGTFTLTATPQTQLIHGAGQTVYQLTVTSLNGFTGPVTLGCGGLPADATCAFGQATVTLTANGSVKTTMTTTTTAKDATAMLLPRFDGRRVVPGFSAAEPQADGSLLTVAAMLPVQLGGLGLFAAGARRRRQLRSRFSLLALLALSLALMGLAGCGCPPTGFHVYPITITGTSTLGGPSPSSAVVYLYVAQANS